ncbi:MAG: hypothetical protein WC635_02870 [Bacteriovorax sp.]|jgi:hypothetical protein
MYKVLTFMILILFAASLVFAEESLSPISYDLSNGKTIAAGQVIDEKDGKRYFVTQKTWFEAPAKIEIPTIYRHMVKYKPGKPGVTNLFVALQETINGKVNYNAFEVRPINDQYAKDAIEKLASRNTFSGSVNPSWQFCEADRECIIKNNQCGYPIAVNKKYQKNYLDFLKTIKTKTDCTKVSLKALKSEVKCIENFCGFK